MLSNESVRLTIPTSRVSVSSLDSRDLALKLVLSTDPRLLGVVRCAVQRLAAEAGFGEEDCRAITLAIDETLTNIIRHAYENRHDESMELTCRLLDGGVEFIARDHGRPIDLAKVCAQALDGAKPGGLGTHIIRRVMDQVQYESLPGANQVRLVKYLAKSGG